MSPNVRAPISRADVPDALFATDNEYGIPLLRDDLQAGFVHLPVMPWGAIKRNQKMPGTWHFYVEDYRFEATWSDASPVVNSACVAVVEPNFSTSDQMPRAVALYQIYRKRWLARYWQAHGIRVFVDLNVSPEHYDIALLGVPFGWRSYMTRGYGEQLECLQAEYALAVERACTTDIVFAVYGGGAAVKALCEERGDWIHIPEMMSLRKETVI